MDRLLHRPRMQAHADALPLPIRRSWDRCSSLAGTLAAEPVMLSRGDLEERQARHAGMLRAAQPEVDTLADMVAGAASMVVLADATGVILQATGNTEFLRRADRVALRPGVSWAEAHRGTNAVGTALVEGSALCVHGAEHFLPPNRILSCHAAPVRSPRGEVVGVLDISSDAARLHAYALGLAKLFARQIGNRIIEQADADCLHIVLHAQPASLDSAERGLLRVQDERIVGANDAALALLHADWAGLLDQPVAHWLPAWKSLEAAPRPIQARGGVPLHALMHRPGGLRVAVPAACAVPAAPEPATRRARAFSAERELPALPPDLLPDFGKTLRALDGGLSILIHGETGTGKEVYARHLHAASRWRHGPFVAINCGALTETLVEAELFGYEAGAYTGARRNGLPGKLREADGGILFLDEIGDMPLALQTRLLRVLQERQVQPLGSTRTVPVDFGVVSATNRPLVRLLAQGRFRDDLYYRLQDHGVALPPLRARGDLVRFIAAELARCAGEGGPRLSAQALELLASRDWPGNYRQLHAALRGLALLHPPGATIDVADLAAALRQASHAWPAPSASRHDGPLQDCESELARDADGAVATLRDTQARRIAQALTRHHGNVSQAARALGIHRSTLHRHLARIKSCTNEYRTGDGMGGGPGCIG